MTTIHRLAAPERPSLILTERDAVIRIQRGGLQQGRPVRPSGREQAETVPGEPSPHEVFASGVEPADGRPPTAASVAPTGRAVNDDPPQAVISSEDPPNASS